MARRIFRRVRRKARNNAPVNQHAFFEPASEQSFFAPKVTAPTVHRTCEECEKEKSGDKVQRAAAGVSNAGSASVSSYVSSLQGKGSSLSSSAKQFFAPRFNSDFSDVKIHNDHESAEMASAINAKAFTYKNHIVFNKGQYNENTSAGKHLLAHELTHTIQQKKSEPKAISREPDFSGVIDNRYSYSTHCGWIDWGHVNPTLARNLIAVIREASKRIKRRDDALQKKVTAELPTFIKEDKCPPAYDKDEVKTSASDPPVESILSTKSGAVEIRIGGFEVGSYDPSKFKTILGVHAAMINSWPAFKGVPFDLKIGGFTDCVGSVEKNTALRNSRASAAFIEMARALPGQVLMHIPFHPPLNEFLASNASAAGRKINRGVLLQLIPHADPEKVTTPAMQSSAMGLTLSEVTPTVSLHKPLTEQQVLQAALTTFMVQSIFFEAAQSWTDFIGSSSYSEEDLVSNLLGFYRAAEGYALADVKTYCDVWDQMKSLEKLKGYSFQKNKTFRPVNLPPGGAWPAEFTTIRPMGLTDENFSILSMFIRPSFAAPNKCQIHPNGTLTCS